MHLDEPLIDAGSFTEEAGPGGRDPLAYPGYRDALTAAAERSGADESVVCGRATIGGVPCRVALFRFPFLGGSMGEAAGERLALALERSAGSGLPFVLKTATGGARMQEGMRALVQMPKVVGARVALGQAGVPFVAVLAHPTTGGVLASLAALADHTIAEAGATIGFAGPRVAEAFTGSRISETSHTAVSALEHGLVDALTEPSDTSALVAEVLRCLAPDEPRPVAPPDGEATDGVDAWAAVERVRDPARPRARELIERMTDVVVTLRGDRSGGDDPAVLAALARVRGRRCVLLGLEHGAAPGPRAYRKAVRAVRTAARLRIPVVTLVDTKGADPSEGSEAGGIAWAIASLFEELLTCETPVLAVVTGEGGSGGALAFATGDRLIMYSDATFSVIAPEGAAAILWRDPERAPEAAKLLRLTARDMKELGIADEIVGADLSSESLADVVAYHLGSLSETRPSAAARRDRWRSI